MVLLEFSMSPIGEGESLSRFVARSLDIIDRSGLPYQLTPMGTIIEGEWDEVFEVVRRCYAAMSADCNRVSVNIRVDARKGASGRLEGKIRSVEGKVGRTLRTGG